MTVCVSGRFGALLPRACISVPSAVSSLSLQASMLVLTLAVKQMCAMLLAEMLSVECTFRSASLVAKHAKKLSKHFSREREREITPVPAELGLIG